MTVPTSPRPASPDPSSPTRVRAQRAQVAQYIRDLSSRAGGRSYEHGARRRRNTAAKERG
jgi:hypothetical protein